MKEKRRKISTNDERMLITGKTEPLRAEKSYHEMKFFASDTLISSGG